MKNIFGTTFVKNQKTAQLVRIGEYGEDIYGYAQTGKWGKANADLKQLNRTFGKYKSSNGSTDSAFATGLGKQIQTLSQSIGGRDRFSSMQTANLITYKTVKFTSAQNAPLPSEVTLLDYYGRELEIGSLFNNTNQIQSSVSKIRGAWNAVRSSLIEAGGDTQSKTFDNLVGSLEQHHSLNQYSKLAIAVLDKVDGLENVFKSDTDGEGED